MGESLGHDEDLLWHEASIERIYNLFIDHSLLLRWGGKVIDSLVIVDVLVDEDLPLALPVYVSNQ